MKNTLIIAYNVGAYGTYLEWALNSLLSDQSLQLPFTTKGNSHASKLGHHLVYMTNFQQYIASDLDFVTARLHPKTEKNHSLKKNLEYILDRVPRLILLYPDRCHEFMCICNYMTKISSGNPYQDAMAYVDPGDIYQNYDVAPGTDLQNIPAWIQREHMSFNLFDSWRDQVEWYFPDQWQHDRAMIITTKDLFDNFETTLVHIRNFWGQNYKKNISEILTAHSEMIKLQPHLGKDQFCAEIVNSIINPDQPIVEFGIIDMVGQAWIQHQLRINGYELKCHDMNDFPTNTAQLRSLIY
jgi:hypothetical protein